MGLAHKEVQTIYSRTLLRRFHHRWAPIIVKPTHAPSLPSAGFHHRWAPKEGQTPSEPRPPPEEVPSKVGTIN